MKMKFVKCSAWLLFFFPLLLQAGGGAGRVEKVINREFPIQTDGRVEIANKYGNVDIAIGPPGKVRMKITMSVTSGNDKKAQETLDRINVSFEEGYNRVSATTVIESQSKWNWWFSTGRVQMDIHYMVHLPADIYLDLVNRYGDIYVETTNRDLEIDMSYGDIRLGDINGRLKLDMAYSEGTLSQIRDAELELAYSEIEMEDAGNIRMDIKYSDIISGTFDQLKLVSAYSNWHGISVSHLDYGGKYDDVVVEQVGQMEASSAYTNITVQELQGEGNFEMRYGDLKVQNIRPQFSAINIHSSYTGVELQFRPETSFMLDAETNYCEIEYSGLKVSESIEKSSNRILKASRGTGQNHITARMNYGELTIR
jgi:hypothetical protein